MVPASVAAASTDIASRQPGGVLILLLIAFFTLAIAATDAANAPSYPELTSRVVDQAGLLTAEDRAQIISELESLEKTSTDQVAVATVKSLDGYAIEQYSIGLARKWQLGQKDKDNGVLLLVAPAERKVRIEVGRRLEPLMTDAMSKIIIENAIIPKFRRGDFSGGIRDGVRDIKAVLLGDAEEVKRRAVVKRTPQDELAPLIHLLVFAFIVGIILYQMRRAAIARQEWERSLTPEQRRELQRQRRMAQRGHPGVIVIPGGSSDWGGGWSGGGGGGGFSGGGGSFGGGGASGGW
jgi:uncharacterized protein